VIKELVTRGQADALFGVVLILGLILLPVTALVARRRGKSPLLAAVAIGGPPTLVGVLWRVYNVITDRMGLDTVANLLVNLVLFVIVGAACGVGWVALNRRQPDVIGSDASES
jgi:hypothetical protein